MANAALSQRDQLGIAVKQIVSLYEEGLVARMQDTQPPTDLYDQIASDLHEELSEQDYLRVVNAVLTYFQGVLKRKPLTYKAAYGSSREVSAVHNAHGFLMVATKK